MKYINMDPICHKKITEIIANEQVWDLHNSGDFIGYKYDEVKKELTLTWEYGYLEDSFIGIVELQFRNVTYLLITGKDPEIPRDEDLCMEWLYLDDEEIVIEFGGGQCFSITCEEVEFRILDFSKSLHELKIERWGQMDFPLTLQEKYLWLWEKPLKDLTVADLRQMIEQNISLSYLVPLAIGELKANLLTEGDVEPGDLLQSVLRIGKDFWQKHATLKLAVEELIKRQIKFLRISLDEFQR